VVAVAEPQHFELEVEDGLDTLVLHPVGVLDEGAGSRLLDRLQELLDRAHDSWRRVELDLDALASFTDAGLAALVGCAELARRLPEGMRYRASSPTGRGALLAACRGPDDL
jgi:anti-anti-sigma regulatory factor